MAGLVETFRLNVLVVKVSQLNMLSFAVGCFPTLRHNKVRDITASLLTKVFSNVSVEHVLQELSWVTLSGNSANRDLKARVDVAADGFEPSKRERAYADVRVFNPFAPSN